MFTGLQSEAQKVIRLNHGSDSSGVVLDSAYYAQFAEKKAAVIDTIDYPFLSSAGLLFDYGKPVAGLLLDTEQKLEVGAQIEFFNKFFICAEYGSAVLEPDDAYQNAEYKSQGQYYRLGFGYKIDMNPKNNFYFSLRYGSARYQDEGIVTIQSESGLFEEYTSPYKRDDLFASWYEFVLSSEVKVWKGFYAGFHARFRVLNSFDEQAPIDTYSIPGYGRTIDKTIPAVNLYLKYAVGWFRIVKPEATNSQ